MKSTLSKLNSNKLKNFVGLSRISFNFCENNNNPKIKVIRLGNEDYKNLGRKFSPDEMKKYLDPHGFINDYKNDSEYYKESLKEELKLKDQVKEVKIEKEEKEVSEEKSKVNETKKMPKEYGMKPKGLEPTRYGDWERNGKCVDF